MLQPARIKIEDNKPEFMKHILKYTPCPTGVWARSIAVVADDDWQCPEAWVAHPAGRENRFMRGCAMRRIALAILMLGMLGAVGACADGGGYGYGGGGGGYYGPGYGGGGGPMGGGDGDGDGD
jgi:hypothetical protein